MDEEERWKVARKRAGYALAQIANHQMNTWAATRPLDTPKDIIATQIFEAMSDAFKAAGYRS